MTSVLLKLLRNHQYKLKIADFLKNQRQMENITRTKKMHSPNLHIITNLQIIGSKNKKKTVYFANGLFKVFVTKLDLAV